MQESRGIKEQFRLNLMVELTDMNIFIYHASKSITREGKESGFR